MTTFTVRLTTVPGDQSDLHEVHREVKEELLRFFGFYWGTNSAIEDFLTGPGFAPTSVVDADARTLDFTIDAEDPRAEAAEAWVHIGFAAALRTLESTVSQLGWWIDAPQDGLPEVFDAYAPNLDASDPLRAMIAPRDGFVTNISTTFEGLQPVDHVGSVAWYVGNTARPPLTLVEAMVERCERDPEGIMGAVSRTLERLAPRVDLHAIVEDRLTGDNPVGYALAARLLPSLRERDLFTRDEVVELLLRGLELDEPASSTCAEVLGAVKPEGEQLTRAYEALQRCLAEGPPPATRHNAVLALVNLYMHEPSVPDDLIATFQQHTDAPSPLDGLAQWAVSVFTRKAQQSK